MYCFDRKNGLERYNGFAISAHVRKIDGPTVDKVKCVITECDEQGNDDVIKEFEPVRLEELGFYGSAKTMDHVEALVTKEMIIYRMHILDAIENEWEADIGIKLDKNDTSKKENVTFYINDHHLNTKFEVGDDKLGNIYDNHPAALRMALFYHVYGDALKYPMVSLDEMKLFKPVIQFYNDHVYIKTVDGITGYYPVEYLGYSDDEWETLKSIMLTDDARIEELIARADLYNYILKKHVAVEYEASADRCVSVYSKNDKTIEKVSLGLSALTNENFSSRCFYMNRILPAFTIYLASILRCVNDKSYKDSKYGKIMYDSIKDKAIECHCESYEFRFDIE